MWKVQLTESAQTSLRTLDEEERAPILQVIGRLTLGPNPPGVPRAYRLRNRPGLIVMRAGIFRVAYEVLSKDEIAVVDIVQHDRVADYPAATAAE